MDKTKLFAIIAFIIVMLGIIFGSYIMLKPEFEAEKALKNWCNERNIDCRYHRTPQCYIDCENFGMQYFKLESGGFGSDNFNCWCKEGNESKQIW